MKCIILLYVCLSLFSCGSANDCDASAENRRTDECLLIVKTIPKDTDDRFDYRGVNPETSLKCDCNSKRSDLWWAKYKDHIEIGDTIIKKKGELIFSIHKKDSIMSFNFECDGKVYK